MGWLVGWKYRKKITVSATSVTENLVNFPLHVPVANVATITNESPNSIRFTSGDGVTLLPFEWTGFGDSGYSGAFVRVPTIVTENGATIYLYYGNASVSSESAPATVWSDYVIAAHLDAWTTNKVESSHGYTWVGTGNVAQATGVLGGGVDVPTDGTSYLYLQQLPSDLDAQITNTGMAFSAILKNWTWNPSYATINRTVFSWRNTEAGTNGFMLRLKPSNQNIEFDVGSGGTVRYTLAASGKNSGDTCHLAGTATIAAGQLIVRSFVDGMRKANNSWATAAGSLDFSSSSQNAIRISGGSNFGIMGIIDEVRVRKVATSDAWMKFEHANLMTSDNQLAFGTQEEHRPDLAKLYYYQRLMKL